MYALINKGQVVNVIMADKEFVDSFEHGYDNIVSCGSYVGIGFTWNETDGFQPPA